VTNPAGYSPEGEEPEKVYDGDLETKWLDLDFDMNGRSVIVIEFPEPVSFDSYRWVTANDSEERDPVSWTLEVSSDGASWTEVDEKVDASVVTDREATVGPFALAEASGPVTYVRWTITNLRRDPEPDFDLVQVAELVLLDGGAPLPNLSPCDEPNSEPTTAFACDTASPPVGALVTCSVMGGDAGIDILWRAAYNPVFEEAGVTLGADGTGQFSFVVPAAALGKELTVELVEWLAPVSLGVVGGPIPASIPSGGGPVAVPVWPHLLLALAGGLVLRRRSTVVMPR
jgi:hypothetical protein